MSTPLGELLTEAQAGDWLNEQVSRLMIADKMTANTAWINVGQRVLAGDPLLLAAPGQTWVLRPEYDELGPWPVGRRIEVLQRLVEPPAVVVADERGDQRQLPVSALVMYQLDQWRWNR